MIPVSRDVGSIEKKSEDVGQKGHVGRSNNPRKRHT